MQDDWPKMFPLGDACVTWSWESEISLARSGTILSIYHALKDDRKLRDLGMLDMVPAYCSLAIYFHPASSKIDELIRCADGLMRNPAIKEAGGDAAGRSHTFEVAYDGPDLRRVAETSCLPIRGVIETHARSTYTVAMIGFLPHFPYLLGLDKRLATPRLPEPRTRVAAGSVAIGGLQTGIYPAESPGGWNIIGRTDPTQLEDVKPGDTISFLITGGE